MNIPPLRVDSPFLSPTSSRPSTRLNRYSLWAASLLAGCAVVSAFSLAGCSGGGSGGVQAQAKAGGTEPAKAAVIEFLDAIKRGDDDAASGMLTKVARAKTQEIGLTVAPPVNPTARYEVRACENVGDAGDLVHVGTVWSDKDDEGQDSSENIVWVVRLDPEGWRVVGMAMNVFDDMPPLLLNFEDPDDMIAKQEMVAAEMQRRAQAGIQAQGASPAPAGTDATTPQAGQPDAVTAGQPAAAARR